MLISFLNYRQIFSNEILICFDILFLYFRSSCGQIFCADCSEFWAALPDERLYQPVRLCGPCYHTVTSKLQVNS